MCMWDKQVIFYNAKVLKLLSFLSSIVCLWSIVLLFQLTSFQLIFLIFYYRKNKFLKYLWYLQLCLLISCSRMLPQNYWENGYQLCHNLNQLVEEQNKWEQMRIVIIIPAVFMQRRSITPEVFYNKRCS